MLISHVSLATKRKLIVGGSSVSPADHPYIAAIMERHDTNHPQIGPGGASILRKESPAIILTAAHVFKPDDIGNYFVRLYASAWNASYDNISNNYIDSEIVYFRVHPNWDVNNTFSNDIALLWLERDISDIDRLQTVSITNSLTSGQECCNNGDALQVVGYGMDTENVSLNYDNISLSDLYSYRTPTLEAVAVRYIDQESCRQVPTPREVLDSMICAGDEETRKGACLGDSGSPLLKKGTNEQVGIVSWGTGTGDACTDVVFPGVFVNVGLYHDWIQQEITAKEGLKPGQIIAIIIACIAFLFTAVLCGDACYDTYRKNTKENVKNLDRYDKYGSMEHDDFS